MLLLCSFGAGRYGLVPLHVALDVFGLVPLQPGGAGRRSGSSPLDLDSAGRSFWRWPSLGWSHSTYALVAPYDTTTTHHDKNKLLYCCLRTGRLEGALAASSTSLAVALRAPGCKHNGSRPCAMPVVATKDGTDPHVQWC